MNAKTYVNSSKWLETKSSYKPIIFLYSIRILEYAINYSNKTHKKKLKTNLTKVIQGLFWEIIKYYRQKKIWKDIAQRSKNLNFKYVISPKLIPKFSNSLLQTGDAIIKLIRKHTDRIKNINFKNLSV